MALEQHHGPVPVLPVDLKRWLLKHNDGLGDIKRTGLETQGQKTPNEMTDYWDQALKTIAVNGRLAALGSKGRNGEWEDGEGDDIVVWRRTVKELAERHADETK